ncbi:MAG: NAD(+) synthase [Lachnospiraceae bacterium]|jgi:NAD+ synthase (glutamine-hydrolysing)|nr:NAD(+) synthase [Lachnospiraceae bacterium]
MKDGFIKVAAVTPKMKVSDVEYNVEQIKISISEAVERGAKVIVFPELAITGYTCGDLFLQDLLIEKAYEGLRDIERYTDNMDAIIFIGAPIKFRGKLYNTSVAISKGSILGINCKKNIPNYSEYYEKRWFDTWKGNEELISLSDFGVDYEHSGEFTELDEPVYNEDLDEEVEAILVDEDDNDDFAPIGDNILYKCGNYPELIIGSEICEDLWAPDTPSTKAALFGATVIVNSSASNEVIGKAEYRRQLIKSTSARLNACYIYANPCEGESTTDVVYGGHNIIAENGTILGESHRFSTGIIYADLDLKRISFERQKNTSFQLNKNFNEIELQTFNLNVEDTRLDRHFPRFPFVPQEAEKRVERCEEILTIQAMGLKERVLHTNTKTVVIGISGGLDSTLALLVCVRAFDLAGRDRKGILTVTMPAFGTTDRTYNNAVNLAKILGVTFKEVNIKNAVNLHFKDIGHKDDVYDVTYENSQARERTQVLMDLANETGGFVVGTGDLSEMALGWATYNGDHMSMYAVNVSIPKTLVRHLVATFAEVYAKGKEGEALKKVLMDVLDTPVSPELLPVDENGQMTQITEDHVGPYELHDFFLYYFLRQSYRPRKIYRIAKDTFAGIYDEETILKWLKVFIRRFFSQQFKRSCLPDGPKVGTVAISPRGDLRMPSDAVSKLWLADLENV